MSKVLPLDDDGAINSDLPCLSCGYNLRGLDPNGVCPECGIEVGRSQYGSQLVYCSPEWVDKLADGIGWILLSLAASLLLTPMLTILGSLAGGDTEVIMDYIAKLAAGLPAVYGYWLFTTPEPQRLHGTDGIDLRTGLRVLAIASLVSDMGTVGAEQLDAWVAATFLGTSMLVDLGAMIAFFVYARRLVERVPDAGLARQFVIVLWGLGLSTAAAAPLVLFQLFTDAISGAREILIVYGCSLMVLFLVFGTWAFVLLFRTRGLFRRTAQNARRMWAFGNE